MTRANKRVAVTGLGFITSIGNNRAEVLESLRRGRSGIEIFDEMPDAPAHRGWPER